MRSRENCLHIDDESGKTEDTRAPGGRHPPMSLGAQFIAIQQPVYMPWLGYFKQIARADHFFLLDDVQYTKQDWRNRNRVKTANGSVWLTVPVKRSPLSTLINEIEVDERQNWRRRHLLTIEQSYGKCPHFAPFFSDFSEVLNRSSTKLVDINYGIIKLICRFLEIDTPIRFTSELPDLPDEPNDRLIEICQLQGAGTLYQGPAGQSYMDLERFAQRGITVLFQDYDHPVYQQAHGDFLSHQSAIDLIMNTGPQAPGILRASSNF
ncbi:WbqC family protein [Parasphingopyxis sp. CP4]|uniref:WbqC family protein n=1 Tax=Parasphingopyxis sp. CP4 TaxID=2724527 RepID=UPI0015A28B1E|nr:WbqC family protein [Parasphingopyxis sp. CP4]QLC22272.1 WbqC family protein [Parasphingopyxis sp. CP4]